MATNILRVALLGTLPGGEKWSVIPTFATLTSSDVSHDDCQAIVTAINALTIPTGVQQVMNQYTYLVGCRVEARSFAGDLNAQAEGLRGSAVSGSGASNLPFQSSIVVSLRTGLPGARGRGRLYFPATGVALTNNTLRYESALVAGFLAGAKTYLQAIETAAETVLGSPTPLSVWSRVNGATSAVTKLMAGDILDTQRRRRDSIPESYSSVAF